MEIKGNQVVMNKEEFVMILLFQEMAVGSIAAASGLSRKQFVPNMRLEVKSQLTKIKRTRPEQIDQMIEAYVNYEN